MKKQILLTILSTLTLLNNSMATTCTGSDWNKICNLPIMAGERCANPEVFSLFCASNTAGCAEVGGCFGTTPAGHWYAVVSYEKSVTQRCKCGCFGEATKVAGGFNGGDIVNSKKLEEDSDRFSADTLVDFDSNQLKSNKVNGFMYSNSSEIAYKIVTDNESIVLSASHPVVVGDENGNIVRIVTADHLSKEDILLSSSRQPVKIKEIIKGKYSGKMVNFNVVSTNPAEHIVVANDLLMGDLAWQTFLHSRESRLIYRKDIMNAIDKNGVRHE